MTPNTTTLSSGAAAHAIERVRLADLRRSIAGRLEADIALLDRLDGCPDRAPAAADQAVRGAERSNVGGAA